MSIHGIGPTGAGYGGITPRRGPVEGDPAREPRPTAPEPARPESTRSAVEARGLRETPEGVDPKLWSVLTSEERAFMLKAREMGPLTYRPGGPEGRAEAPSRGGRLDVRV